MILVEDLRKTFQTRTETVDAVGGINFEVRPGEIVTLLGPSGCGKTTTLRLVAGLERASGGRIAIGERPVVDVEGGVFVPPHKRRLGMVFQSYAIWPHMTVLENVSYALEGRGLAYKEMKALAMAALDTVQLAHLAARPAPRLSGGQQQRVAIARALAGQPQALLFDEPLSNLDAKLRAEMRTELGRLQKQLGMTSIYVTHDQAEALAISDWIIVMKDGRIVETGRPAQIYRYPKHVYTAQFIGNTNLIPGTISKVEPDGRVVVATSIGELIGVDPTKSLQAGAVVQTSIRPEDLLSSDGAAASSSPVNRLEGRIEFAIFAGAVVEADVRCGETIIHCLLGRDADSTPGSAVSLCVSSDATIVLSGNE